MDCHPCMHSCMHTISLCLCVRSRGNGWNVTWILEDGNEKKLRGKGENSGGTSLNEKFHLVSVVVYLLIFFYFCRLLFQHRYSQLPKIKQGYFKKREAKELPPLEFFVLREILKVVLCWWWWWWRDMCSTYSQWQ